MQLELRLAVFTLCVVVVRCRMYALPGMSQLSSSGKSIYTNSLESLTDHFGIAVVTPDRESDSYPLPPENITEKTFYVDNDEKIMSTTIFWDAESDIRRKNFSITIEAVRRDCQLTFPGFTYNGIPPSYRSFRIPLELNDAEHTALEIEHDCQYRVILVSNPYPPNNIAAYTATFNFTVPHCVQGRCSCTDNTPKAVQNVEVVVVREKNVIVPRISWNHPEAKSNAFVYEVEIVFSRKNLFKSADDEYTDTESLKKIGSDNEYFGEGDMIEKTKFMDQKINSKRGQTHYSLLWPFSLAPNEEYVVFVYVKNKHLCLSFPAKKVFSTFKENLMNINDISGSIADLTSQTLPKTSYSSNILTPNRSAIDAVIITSNSTVTATAGTLINVYPLWIFVLVWILLSVGLLIICCLCYFVLRKYCIQKGKSEIEKSSIIPWAMAHSSHSMLETNILYHRSFGTSSTNIICEIPSSQIQVGAVIGQGAFGMVCMGTINGVEGFGRSTTVAIKQLNVNAEEFQKSEFTAEIDIMQQVGRHPNIVAMYGFCKEPNHQCMIMEYVPFGDLKHYLQELRKQLDIVVYNKNKSKKFDASSSSPSTSMNSAFINSKFASIADSYYLDPNELQNFALQVASGMAHIESLGIIHRDLAARNILVGRGKQLKISDFGLSRRGVYVKTSKGIIPLRWLSIEAIEHNLYSTKSDVWAYGVVLWEICTLAGFPYASVSDKELLKHLQQGSRLEKPSSCANEIYDIMMKCWAEEPTERPSFASLCEYLSDLNNQDCPYVEFLPDDELPPLDFPSECTFDTSIGNVPEGHKREMATAIS